MTRPTQACMTMLVAIPLALAGIAFATQPQDDAEVPGQVPINDPGDVLTRDIDNSRRWTVHTRVRFLGMQPRARQRRNIAPTQTIAINDVQFVFPLIGETSMSVPYPEESYMRLELDRRFEGTPDIVPTGPNRPLNDRIVTNRFETIEGYQGPTSLMRLEAHDLEAVSMILDVQLDVRSWETRIDEPRADAIPWPTGPWPAQLASLLEPQLFVNPEHPSIQALLDQWLEGHNPRDVRPYALAKMLAARVVEHVSFTGDDYHSTGRSEFIGDGQRFFVSGFTVNGSVFAAENQRCSRSDAPALLCAIYRAAGLPARLVIGADQSQVIKQFTTDRPALRSWVEFALLDEERAVTEWIPVDITRQRDFSSKAPPLDQRWEYFGHNEEFDFVAPIAHHWHPPTTVTNAGPPAIWGYLPGPVIPDIDTVFTMDTFESTARGDDPVDPYRRP